MELTAGLNFLVSITYLHLRESAWTFRFSDVSSLQYRADQLVSAAKMGDARELFEETGLHVR
jgi:hypothetical protein